MNKALVFLAAGLLISVQAWAWPSAGDVAEYQIQVHSNGQVYSGQYIMKTIALNAASDILNLEITTVFQGSINTKSVNVKLSEMQQVATRVPVILSRCAEVGGTQEVVDTPAGQFAACKMANDNDKVTGFIWYADVVYGWVKQAKKERANNQVTEVLLTSAKSGQ